MSRYFAVFTVLSAIALSARATPVSLEAGTGATFVTDRAFDVAGETDALPLLTLAARVRPGWADGRLGLRAGWAWTASSATAWQAFQSDFSLHTFDAGATWRLYERGPGALVARGGLSLDLARLALSGGGGVELSGHAFSAGLVGAVGYETWFGDAEAGRRLGMVIEAGYGARLNQAHLKLAPDAAGDAKPAPVEAVAVDAGRMGLSGPFWRIAAIVAL